MEVVIEAICTPFSLGQILGLEDNTQRTNKDQPLADMRDMCVENVPCLRNITIAVKHLNKLQHLIQDSVASP